MNDDLNEKISNMIERMRREQNAQIAYGLTEGFLKYTTGPSGDRHLTHTTPEDFGIDPVAIFEGLEDVLNEIAATYGMI